MPGTIPIFLVTGFLGSGKTTLLREIHTYNTSRRLIYLINDFSANDVDAALFNDEDRKVVSVPGGSIFCTCLVTEFVGRLREILTVCDAGESGYDGLVIEASGTANPTVIDTLLHETGLTRRFRMEKIICVTDPVTLPKLLHTLPNIRQQLSIADQVIINKSDLVSPQELEQLTKTIREINPQVEPLLTQYCALEANPLDSDQKHRNVASDVAAHSPQTEFRKFSLQSRKRLDPETLRQFILDHREAFYRIKGFCYDRTGTLMYFDYALSSGFTAREAHKQHKPHLDFIFPSRQGDTLVDIIKSFAQTAFV